MEKNVLKWKMCLLEANRPEKIFAWFTKARKIHDKYLVLLKGVYIHHFNGFLFYYTIFEQAKKYDKDTYRGTLFRTDMKTLI